MASIGESNFSGAICLASANWTCPNYRRSVAAGLVKGAYNLEKARKESRGCEPTWEKFHFALEDRLVDDADPSIFGAIYKFNPPKSGDASNSSSGDAPKIVVAFRGTKNFKDIKLDLKLFIKHLADTPRFKRAMRVVEEMASAVGSQNLWLAGHSLGASIAMFAGKKMAMKGTNIETFLFNPPHPSCLVNWIPSKTAKRTFQATISFLSVAFALMMEGCRENSRDYFAKLSSWVPHLFVNSDDIFCSGYIGYFECRESMRKIGVGSVARLATRTPLISALLGDQSEPLHLFPSANLWINSLGRNVEGILDCVKFEKEAHSIAQWSQELNLQYLECRYN